MLFKYKEIWYLNSDFLKFFDVDKSLLDNYYLIYMNNIDGSYKIKYYLYFNIISVCCLKYVLIYVKCIYNICV